MLIRYGFRNFFSFKEESFISFELDKNVPESISNGRDYSTVIGIKGANSSGKTNIIKALSFLRDFVTTSSKKENYRIPVSPFLGSKDNTYVYAEFSRNNTTYKYEVEICNKEVVTEKISRKNKKWVTVLAREGLDIKTAISEIEQVRDIKIAPNTSMLSTLSNFKFFENLEDLKNVYEFFYNTGTNVSAATGMFSLSSDFRDMSERYYNAPEMFEFVKEFIRRSDMSIVDVEIISDIDKDGEEYFSPIFKHSYNGETIDMLFRDQSSGTKSLFMVLGVYKIILDTGGVLALDEFDIHLHALLLPLILELFTSKKYNPNNAQFIFTAHNTEIIDTLGRYRSVLVNKENSESYCYRLDEIGGQILRNDRPISPVYTKGLIGGVPRI
ncbi:AAA family ATPase [Pseudomonas fluorescens]|uniref:AAA family ATPase n=1 Tax=Pseudomonas fluorescens TaxID=294 RepID=UPI00177BE696|nr:ATP-binding protein [Pseudomonas fluorescens]